MIIDELKERFKLFSIQPYLYFALSGILATLGNGLIYITVSWLAYEKMHSISGIALMMFCIWLPTILFGPFFGVCADKYNRKNLMIMSNMIRGLAVIGFVIVYHLGFSTNIFILAVFLGIFVSFYMPAAVPMISSIVPENDLMNANATIDMIYELGTIIGMGVSGFLVLYLGLMNTLALGGLLFLLAGTFNWFMECKPEHCYGTLNKEKSGFIEDYISSLNYLKDNPRLLGIYSIQTCIMILLMTIPILLLPYTKEVLKVGPDKFSTLEALFSMGIFIGCLISPILCRLIKIKRTLLLLMVGMAIGLYIFSINENLIISYIFYFIIGFGLSSWALSLTQAQLLADKRFQGRLQSTFNSISGVGVLAIYLLITFRTDLLDIHKMYNFQIVIALCAIVIILMVKDNIIESASNE
ncbi:MAG: MFS transporter [Legionella sp.]|nr:MFS transporter [Legionella sp.]